MNKVFVRCGTGVIPSLSLLGRLHVLSARLAYSETTSLKVFCCTRPLPISLHNHSSESVSQSERAESVVREQSSGEFLSMASSIEPVLNSVEFLLENSFERLDLGTKLAIKNLGPHTPDIDIVQTTMAKGRTSNRTFSRAWYEKKAWLSGCSKRNKMFCFPCLLFRSPGGVGDMWSTVGVYDMKHFSEKAKKHESSKSHLNCAMKLAMLGNANIAAQLHEGYSVSVRNHNKEVDKNRHILSKLIDCIRFCGAFELALRGHDETESSNNPGVFRGLVDLVASLDNVMHEHLQNATVFRGTSKTIQNELLDCMFDVMQGHIIQELKDAEFISIQADETTDVSTHCQLVVVFRYIDTANTVQERFFSFKSIDGQSNADGISAVILDQLRLVCSPEITADRARLIAQTYDGASVMRGASGGVRKKVQDVYPNAHFIHCYAHQLNLVMEQAASALTPVRCFFSDLGGFSGFFSRSPKRAALLDEVVETRLPRSSQTRWNFGSRAVCTVFENRDRLLECFERIQASRDFDSNTVREDKGFSRMLSDPEFLLLLDLFYQIMPRVDVLYAQLQKRGIDAVEAHTAVNNFVERIQKIRDDVPTLCARHSVPPTRSARATPNYSQIAHEVCDTIIVTAKDRFQFTTHLSAAILFDSSNFATFSSTFPTDLIRQTAEAYPVFDEKRCTELYLINENPDFRTCSGAGALFEFMVRNNLQGVFAESVKLLRVLITTPMTTAESERCFSTLKRIKTFLRNTMSQERLNALAMLSVEKKKTNDIPNFNKLVIEKFATQKERRAKFLYK